MRRHEYTLAKANIDSPAGSASPLLELHHARKTFGAVFALAGATIEILPGEIHALVGENGAGKSVFIKVLAGVHQSDSGDFRLDGRTVSFSAPADSKSAGISVIYQEPTLFPTSPSPRTSSSAASLGPAPP